LDPIAHPFAIVVMSFTSDYVLCPISISASCGCDYLLSLIVVNMSYTSDFILCPTFVSASCAHDYVSFPTADVYVSYFNY
jgi:hypothetical protein